MLELYDGEVMDCIKDKSSIIYDVEEAFAPIKLVNDNETVEILKNIEQAKFVSENKIEDRFGCIMYKSELSTGCKAALCVHYLKDKIIDLKECGLNARNTIIKVCKQGAVIFYGNGVTFPYDEDDKVNIRFKGKEFFTIESLNDFMNSY